MPSANLQETLRLPQQRITRFINASRTTNTPEEQHFSPRISSKYTKDTAECKEDAKNREKG
jgi:hypothetical protein